MATLDENILKKMEENSKAWHAADAATKKQLEAQNQQLGAQIGGIYNSATGTWSNSSGGALFGSGSSSGSSSSGSSGPVQTPGTGTTSQTTGTGTTGSNPYTVAGKYTVSNDQDIGELLKNMMNNNYSASDVQAMLDARINKANSTPGLGQYAYDDLYWQAMNYINSQNKISGQEGLNSALDANNLAVQQAINNLQNQIPGINQNYDELLRQNEINNILEQENIRRGSVFGSFDATGLPDTLKTAQSTAYQNLRNQSELERQNDLREIENAIVDAQLTGDINKANILADYYQSLAAYERQNAQMNTQRGWEVEDRDLNRKWAVEDRDFTANYNTTQADKDRAQTQAWNMMSAGVMPSSALLEAAGISLSDAQAYVAAVKASMAAATTGSSRSGGSGGSGGTNKTKKDDTEGTEDTGWSKVTANRVNESVSTYLKGIQAGVNYPKDVILKIALGWMEGSDNYPGATATQVEAGLEKICEAAGWDFDEMMERLEKMV